MNQVRIYSLNAQYEAPPKDGFVRSSIEGDSQADRTPRILEIISSTSFDVFALQEVSILLRTALEELANEHGFGFTSALHHTKLKTHNVTLYNKEVVVDSVGVQFEPYRSAVVITLATGLRIVNVHVSLDIRENGEREEYMVNLEKVCKGADKLVIIGDFNTVPSTPATTEKQMAFIESRWTMHCPETPLKGNGTWFGKLVEPEHLQGQRSPAVLDRLCTSKSGVVVEEFVGLMYAMSGDPYIDGVPQLVSDHLLLRAVVSLTNE